MSQNFDSPIERDFCGAVESGETAKPFGVGPGTHPQCSAIDDEGWCCRLEHGHPVEHVGGYQMERTWPNRGTCACHICKAIDAKFAELDAPSPSPVEEVGDALMAVKGINPHPCVWSPDPELVARMQHLEDRIKELDGPTASREDAIAAARADILAKLPQPVTGPAEIPESDICRDPYCWGDYCGKKYAGSMQPIASPTEFDLRTILGVGQKFPDEQKHAIELVQMHLKTGEHAGKEHADLMYAMDVIVNLLRVFPACIPMHQNVMGEDGIEYLSTTTSEVSSPAVVSEVELPKLLTAEQVLDEVDEYCTNGGGNPVLAPILRKDYEKTGRMAHAVLVSLNLEPVTMWKRKGAK